MKMNHARAFSAHKTQIIQSLGVHMYNASSLVTVMMTRGLSPALLLMWWSFDVYWSACVTARFHSLSLHSLQCEHRHRLLLSPARSFDKLTSDDNFLYCLNIHCWERVSLTTHTRWNIHPIYISRWESWRHRLVCSWYTRQATHRRIQPICKLLSHTAVRIMSALIPSTFGSN